jgi:chromosome segregation protein
MYLKSLEILGFKSFADRIYLEFEPGLTAIVGPNGCGKSNVSDAVRWVIGEQSAKALRGAKMEDCIFNGTDDRKPLGMAEVSLTLGDCDDLQDMGYHEITVTRRVFRSGEGQYFLNKAPCRLRDIQRLFMDTGVGAASYSLMEQGRIDQVLSSRPEDRRAIFEQASGITKFKTDRLEAIRKLDHTEANLLRLADVIREVKRQIGSLQRQAGKARRYKELRDRLRRYDLAAARDRLHALETEKTQVETDLARARADIERTATATRACEEETTEMRSALSATERDAAAALEAGQHARQRLHHTREMIQVNRQRIQEYQSFSERDTRDMESLGRHIEEHRAQAATAATQIEEQSAVREREETLFRAAAAAVEANRARMEESRHSLRRWREEAVQQESLGARLRNRLIEIEAREKAAALQREKLLAEKSRLASVVQTYETRQTELGGQLEEIRRAVEEKAEQLEAARDRKTEHDERLHALRQEESRLKSQRAAKWAGIEFLQEAQAAGQGFSPGARLALDAANPLGLDASRVLGALAATVEAEAEYKTPLLAALKSWSDAVLVLDREMALQLVSALRDREDGAARLLVADGAPPEALPAEAARGCRLLDHVSVEERVQPLFERLLGGTFVVESLDEIPDPIAAGATYVTRDGVVVRADGSYDVCREHRQDENPLVRKHALDQAEREHARLETRVRDCLAEMEKTTALCAELSRVAEELRRDLDERRRQVALKEGEWQVVADEVRQARERLRTVGTEWDELTRNAAESDAGAEQAALTEQIEQTKARCEEAAERLALETDALQETELGHEALQKEASERRACFADAAQELENLRNRHRFLQARIEEMSAALEGRRQGIDSHRTAVQELEELIHTAENQIDDLKRQEEEKRARAEVLKTEGAGQAERLAEFEKTLTASRSLLDALKKKDTDLEVRLAENRLRHQNLIERVTAAYSIGADAVMLEPEPAWEGEKPAPDALDAEIAEMRAKIEAMGPVNLVAIDELRELEERYAFLAAQEEDLVKAKSDLLEMIRKISETTSEMFRSTFDRINANFEIMFKQLFNGGSAKLALSDESNILECGIDIVVRPPGKRLQNISLLSGGERTLTAVALLFAIYLCKPSPFCLLDELDAALDESNIARFVKTLQGFLDQSQFVVITHNRQTIAAANTLYGVTMPQKGVSKIMSMKFKEAEKVAEKSA